MVGVDYATESVELANRLWKEITTGIGPEDEGKCDGDEGTDGDENDEEEQEGETNREPRPSASTAPIEFYTHNILSPLPSPCPTWLPEGGFDVVLDKGTFDAISLSEETDAKGRRICGDYAGAIKELVKRGGMLLITSCNWTEDELQKWIVQEGEKDGFEVCGRVPYPRFKFGGVEGQSVVGVAFRRKKG